MIWLRRCSRNRISEFGLDSAGSDLGTVAGFCLHDNDQLWISTAESDYTFLKVPAPWNQLDRYRACEVSILSNELHDGTRPQNLAVEWRNSPASFSWVCKFKFETGDRLRGFSKTLQSNGTVPHIRLRSILTTYSLIHCSLIIVPFRPCALWSTDSPVK
jgi:hypothetical protein